MFITKRELNKKLDLLIYRQNLLATIIVKTQLDGDRQKRIDKKWNEIWKEIMEEKDA